MSSGHTGYRLASFLLSFPTVALRCLSASHCLLSLIIILELGIIYADDYSIEPDVKYQNASLFSLKWRRTTRKITDKTQGVTESYCDSIDCLPKNNTETSRLHQHSTELENNESLPMTSSSISPSTDEPSLLHDALFRATHHPAMSKQPAEADGELETAEDLVSLSSGTVTPKTWDKLDVTILGLFELTQGTESRPEGPSELEAAKLAIDRINQMDIVPKFRVKLLRNDTRVSWKFLCYINDRWNIFLNVSFSALLNRNYSDRS